MLGAVLLLLAGCQNGVGKAPPLTGASGTEERLAPQAQAFVLPALGGGAVSLTEFQGQVVLVNFWASWCASCHAEMEDLDAYFRAHEAEGFLIIGVNVKEPVDVVRDFANQYDPGFPIVLDEDGRVADMYQVTGLPYSFFVDREGTLLGFWPGPLNL
ncbi:MAG: TlpA family protein disulfide reductase, partial [Anaerolineae bacterium]|nr:TlpA family protein disulfide reductase [Anaerolineae bacterium]